MYCGSLPGRSQPQTNTQQPDCFALQLSGPGVEFERFGTGQLGRLPPVSLDGGPDSLHP